jgi:phosphoglycerate dehydrogenase-like enzyme
MSEKELQETMDIDNFLEPLPEIKEPVIIQKTNKKSTLSEAKNSDEPAQEELEKTAAEPLEENNELWDMKNVYITPHASGIVKNNKTRWEKLIKINIQNFVDNEALINVIK